MSFERYQQLSDAKGSYLTPDIEPRPVPAPVGGWDAISPLANMEAKYAVTLQNWVPRPGWVELRGGYNTWVQLQQLGNSLPVQTLLVYRPPGSGERLFAAAGTIIYEVSTLGLPAASVTGLSNARIQYTNFTPSGGSHYLVLANGADSVKNFDGSVWTIPAITNVSSNTLIYVHSHMRRLWFIEANSTRVWFLATDAISGAATSLDVGSIISQGSYLVAMQTWTVDGGNGPNALLALITSRGQIIIYQGTDPTNSSAWTLVGVFDQSPPIGRRCFQKMGSDVAMITLEGVVPLSKSLPFNPGAIRSVAFTNQIQNAMLLAAQSYSTNFGWEVCFFPKQTLMILNVPIVENSSQTQYVMNTLTGAWCSFTGWNANCFAIFNDNLYFGDNTGNVNLAYTGATDLNNSISYDLKCAFNFFEEPGRVKQMTFVKPYFVSTGSITPSMSVDVDFGTSSPSFPLVTLTPSGAVWDVSLWDVAQWGGSTVVIANWLSVNAVGTALAIRMNFSFSGTSTQLTQVGVFDSAIFDTSVFDGTGITGGSGIGIPLLQLTEFESIVSAGGPV